MKWLLLFKRNDLLILCSLLLLLSSSLALQAQDVPLYRIFEQSVTNNNSYGNRFTDVTLTTQFTHSASSTTINFWGFFDGDGNGGGNASSGNVWKMRFMPTELGTWNYTWSWSDSTSGGSGNFECVAAGAGPGVMKAYQGNRTWLAYNETDPVFMKSCYIITGGLQIDDINWVGPNIYQKVYDRGYNHMQLNMLPLAYTYQHFADGPNGGNGFMYYGTNPSSSMSLDYCKRVDQHMSWLNDHDMSVNFFQGIDGKDVYGDGSPNYGNMSSFERDFLIRYLCARLAPYANICGWTYTWETNNGNNERDLMDRLNQYDPWAHLKTYMQGVYNAGDLNDGWWGDSRYTFISTEAVWSDRNGCTVPTWFVYDIIRRANDLWDKPVFHSEDWGLWGAYNACTETVRRHAWANVMAGGSATWGDVTDWEPVYSTDLFGRLPEGAFSYELMCDVMMNDVEFWKLNPYDSVSGAYALAEPGRQYVAYKENGGSFDLTVASGSYVGQWVNCVNGNRNDIGTVNGSGGSMNFNSPFGGTDSVLVLAQPQDPDTVLNLAANAISTSQIDLSWELQPGSSAQNYRIERKLAVGSFAELAQVSNSTTSYNDTGLEAGTTFVYRMRADLGGANYSAYSNEDNATTFDSPPIAPSNLTAVASTTALQITLTWVDNSDNEEGFAIERKSDGAYTEIATVGYGTQTYVDSNALAGQTTYFYRVRAFNSGGGQYSGYSNEAWDTTPCVLDPQIIDDADIPPLAYSGSWNAQTGWAGRYNETIHESESGGAYVELPLSDVAEVKIYGDTRSWGGTAEVTVDSVSQGSISYQGSDADSVLIGTITGDLGCGSHTMRITVNGDGWCYLDYLEYTPLCCTAVDKVPADPSNLTTTAVGGSQIDLRWLDNSGDDSDEEDSFTVERSDDGGSSFDALTTVSGVPGTGNTVNYSDAGLIYGTTYCYRVMASNGIGDSGYTTEECDQTGPPDDPAAPTGLSAPAESGKVTLTWNANTETDPAVLYYTIYRSTTEGGPYTAVAVVFGGTNVVDSNVINDTTYYYRVSAVDTWPNESDMSVEVAATPSEPTVPADPSNLQVTAVTSSSISLSWSDNSDNEDEFLLERKEGISGTYALIATLSYNTSSHTDNGLEIDTEYCYRVLAQNEVGPSGYSNEVCDTTTGCTPEPVTVDDADALVNYTGTWSAQSGWNDRYLTTLHETNSSGATATFTFDGATVEILSETQDWGGTADILIDGISQGTMSCQGATQYQVVLFSKTDLLAATHTLQIVCQGNGWVYLDAITYTGCALPPTPPAAPTNLVATEQSSSQIRLTWTDNATNEAGFKVERKMDGESVFTQVAMPGVDAQSYVDPGLQAETTYTYRARAYNAAGDSAYSNEDSATTTDVQTTMEWHLLDDWDSAIVYTGNWEANRAECGWELCDEGPVENSNLTNHRTPFGSALPGLKARLDFTGTAIEVLVTRYPWTGDIKVTLDGVSHTVNTTVGYVDILAKVWEQTGLVNGPHTVEIETLNDEMVFDGFRFYGTTPVRPIPSAPGNLSVTGVAGNIVELSWTDNSDNESGFRIERQSGPSWEYLYTIGQDITTFSDGGLSPSTTYTYRVCAVNLSDDQSAYVQASGSTTGGGNQMYQVYGVDFFGSDPYPTNPLLLPPNAFDGNELIEYESVWIDGGDAHFGVDLGTARRVVLVRYRPRITFWEFVYQANDVAIEGSNTGPDSGYVILGYTPNLDANPAWRETSISDTTPYRWIRFRKGGQAGASVIEIYTE